MSRRWFIAGALLLVAAAALLAIFRTEAPKSDTEARLQYYLARVGGQGTYPAYARLGAAYIQKARETGDSQYLDDAERNLLASVGFQRNFEAIRSLALLCLEKHRFIEALQYAKEAVETLPSDLEAKGILADVYLALGDTGKAAALVDEMTASQANFATLARRANIRIVQGDLAGALESMQAACDQAERERSHVETRAWCQVRLGSILMAKCDAGAAERAYKRAFRYLPDYFLAVEHLAELRAAEGNRSEAIGLYQSLMRRRPTPAYQAALADLYEWQGQQQLATAEREQLKAELRTAAKGGTRTDLPTLTELLLEKPETAAEGLMWAEQDWKNRQDAIAASTLAWAFYQNGRYQRARDVVEPVLRSGTKDARIFLRAARIYSKLGDYSKARTLVELAGVCRLLLNVDERAAADELAATLPSVR